MQKEKTEHLRKEEERKRHLEEALKKIQEKD